MDMFIGAFAGNFKQNDGKSSAFFHIAGSTENISALPHQRSIRKKLQNCFGKLTIYARTAENNTI